MNLWLCDDHQTFSEALGGLLEAKGHRIVRRTGSPDEAADNETAIDVCVLDLQFPGFEGCEAVASVRRSAPALPIVVLTASQDRDQLERALDSGASAVVLKTEGVNELESVLKQVEAAAGASVRPRIRSRQAQTLGKRRARNGRAPDLTPREAEVLAALVDGLTTAQIATSLGVETATVRTHVQHLFGKFGAHSRVELVANAIRVGAGAIRSWPDAALPQTS